MLARVAVANLVMGAVLLAFRGDMPMWLAAAPLERVARLTALIGVGTVLYGGVLLVLGVRPRQLLAPVNRKADGV